ncbi:MAG: hypothetical protein ACFFAY_10725 [Promethearchaeota archaeon]
MAFEDELGLPDDKIQPGRIRLGAWGIIQEIFNIFTKRIGAFFSIILMFAIFGFIQGYVLLVILALDEIIVGAIAVTDPLAFILNVSDLLQIYPDPSVLSTPIAAGAVLMFAGFLIQILITGAAIRLALETYAGRHSNVSECFSEAIGRIVPLTIVYFVISSVMTLILRPLSIISLLMLDAIDTMDLELAGAYSGQAILLMVLLLFAFTLFLVAMVDAMQKDHGPFQSLSTSFRLTGKNIGYTLKAVIMFAIVVFVIQLTIELAFVLFLGNSGLLLSFFIYQIIYLSLLYTFQSVFYKNVQAKSASSQSQDLW